MMERKMLRYGLPLAMLICAGAIPCAVNGGSETMLPAAKWRAPSYKELRSGQLKVRLLPGAKNRSLMFCSYIGPAENVISAVDRLKLGDSWFCFETVTNSPDFEKYLQTGQPVITGPPNYWGWIYNKLPADDKDLTKFLDNLDKHAGNQYVSIYAAEWENLQFDDVASKGVFGKTLAEMSKMTRKDNYESIIAAVRNWKKATRGRFCSSNGYSLYTHIVGEAGADTVGVEVGENVPATQVQRAFARGAARQYGIPWHDQVSPWFGAGMPSGVPTMRETAPGKTEPANLDTGHSVNMLERLWYTGWFGGAAFTMIEAATGYIFNVPVGAKEFPKDVKVSDYGEAVQKLFRTMKTVDVGVPYTPFGVLINKYHGRWTTWFEGYVGAKPFVCIDESLGDKMMVRFFETTFPGLTKGVGKEEHYLCPSPYGDTFDVLVNNANRSAWGAYPVLLAVGDIPWTSEDIAYLKGYIKAGGILALNEINVEGWDRAYLGLVSGSFAPAGSAKTVLASPDGTPLLIRRDIGKGHLFVSSKTPDPGVSKELAFPTAFLGAMAERFLPFKVEGDVEYLINRTSDGWAMLVVNNAGWTKMNGAKPEMDLTKTAQVKVKSGARVSKVTELYAGEKIGCERTADGWVLGFNLKPGDMKLIKISM
jgi:hypothetical protein